MTLNRMRVKKSHEKIIFWEGERNKFLKKERSCFILTNKQQFLFLTIKYQVDDKITVWLKTNKNYFDLTFELLLHARWGLWSPSSMQELSSFHLFNLNLVCCDEYDMGVLCYIKRVLWWLLFVKRVSGSLS